VDDQENPFDENDNPEADQTHHGINLQKKLAGYIRWYFQTSGKGVDGEEQQEALRWICSALARLLGELLEGKDGWSRWYWVDDIVPTAERVLPGDELHVEGMATWGESGPTDQWVEPFSASVQIGENCDSILRYEIKFGDAGTGLGQIPYGKHRSHIKPGCPDEWMFVLRWPTTVPNA
jgi:hypothetical protein